MVNDSLQYFIYDLWPSFLIFDLLQAQKEHWAPLIDSANQDMNTQLQPALDFGELRWIGYGRD